MRRLAVLLALAAAFPAAAHAGGDELAALRARIRAIRRRLERLGGEVADAERERQRLRLELDLARARVEETQLVLAAARAEAKKLGTAVRRLGEELERRRRTVRVSLQMMALLGRPGTVRLWMDALRGGDLLRAVDTVGALTAGQLRLQEEYERLRRERARRLGELSRRLEAMREAADQLAARRQRLAALEAEASVRLARLEREARRTRARLRDLEQRAAALERLMTRLAGRRRIPPQEDVHRYRGALPWPAPGRIVRRFGRHRIARYATYTVNNGVWLDVAPGAEVRAPFPGEVAFASHFSGYGNTVVVDHGHGVYSVVAGVATLFVRAGDRVQLGTELGLAGPRREGGNLYVEIRADGAPRDPERWFRLRGSGGS